MKEFLANNIETILAVIAFIVAGWKAKKSGALNTFLVERVEGLAKPEDKDAIKAQAIAAGVSAVLKKTVVNAGLSTKEKPASAVKKILQTLLPLFLAVAVLPGCSLVAPDKTEIVAEKAMWVLVNDALSKSDALHEQSLVQLRDYAIAQAVEGNRQAALDDIHVATKDGHVPTAEMERITEWLAKRNSEETTRIWAAYTAGSDPKSRRDLRQVIAKMESLRMARLSAEELKQEALAFLMSVGKDVGLLENKEVPNGNP